MAVRPLKQYSYAPVSRFMAHDLISCSQGAQGPGMGVEHTSLCLRAFAVYPPNPALHSPTPTPTYYGTVADVHLPPTYLCFPPAAPRHHIDGPNKTYTPPALPKYNPSICVFSFLQT
ncbi:hypothetical protein F5B20DRAFT_532325 [Whalleya microplaca]|nr:hypothetical protein F5B20DRAFT_532325 [Whalleya microplaca]